MAAPEESIVHSEVSPTKDWIFASGPFVGRLRRRLVPHETFLDDCAYGIAEVAAELGEKRVRATDDLRAAALALRGGLLPGYKSATVSSILSRLYGALFASLLGAVFGAFLFVPAIYINPPKVSAINGEAIKINYTDADHWTISANLEINIVVGTHAYFPVQLYIPESIVEAKVVEARRLQQYDSAVILKGEKDNIRDGDTRHGGGDTRHGGGHYGDLYISGDMETSIVGDLSNERLSVGTGGDARGRSNGIERHGDGDGTLDDKRQGHSKTVNIARQDSRKVTSVHDVFILGRLKAIGEPQETSGRCIGKLMHISRSVPEKNPIIIHSTISLRFRLVSNLSANEDCRKVQMKNTEPRRSKMDDEDVSSVKSLAESCRLYSGILLAVDLLGLRAFTTVTLTSLDGRLTPYVYVQCQSIAR